ncbi:polymer-forming cytoskeletal protein [Candidatus Uhrbacteria bacterium]|nr:polymer-forming cytoskeletal protein [Candidatus Uhrbacteria bacterium]
MAIFQKNGTPIPVGSTDSIETIIAPGVRVEGEVGSRGNITVEGEVYGSIKTDQHLRIGSGAKIFANVKAQSAFVSGTISGNLKIKDRLELTQSATIVGDVETKTIIIAEGGMVHGKVEMLSDAKAKELRSPSKSEMKSSKEDEEETA